MGERSPTRVLVLGDSGAVLIRATIDEMVRRWPEISFDVLDWNHPLPLVPAGARREVRTRTADAIERLPRPLRRTVKLIRFTWRVLRLGSYDVCHVQYLHPFYRVTVGPLLRRCRRLLVTVWGTDVRISTPFQKRLQAAVLRRARLLTFSGESARDYCRTVFPPQVLPPTRLVRFGLSLLPEIDAVGDAEVAAFRAAAGIDPGAVIVLCGYNASPNCRHGQIIDALRDAPDLPSQLHFLFPLTYGGPPRYVAEVQDRLRRSGLRASVVQRFLTDHDTAVLRRASAVLVQVAGADQFSASVQEHLYAGGTVIAGAWLDYTALEDAGASFVRVSSAGEVPGALRRIAQTGGPSPEAVERNRQSVRRLSSWSIAAPQWKAAMDECLHAEGELLGVE